MSNGNDEVTRFELATPEPGTGATTVTLRDVPVGAEFEVLIEYSDQFVNSLSGDAQFYLRRHESWKDGPDEGLNPIPEKVGYEAEVVGGQLLMRIKDLPLGQFQITQDIQYGEEFNMRWTESSSWSTDKSKPRSGSLTLQVYSEGWDEPIPEATLLEPEENS